MSRNVLVWLMNDEVSFGKVDFWKTVKEDGSQVSLILSADEVLPDASCGIQEGV